MADLTISDTILSAVQAHRKERAATSDDPRALDLVKRKAFAYGNQAGDNLKYWAGLKPAAGADPKDIEEFKRRIVIADVLSGALNTYTSHILGNDPDWVPTDSESGAELNDKAEETVALTYWHKHAELHAKLKKADYDMRWGGVSYLRMLIPDVLREIAPEAVTQGGQDLKGALRLAHLQALDALEAGCTRDASGVALAYWHAYSKQVDGKPVNFVEVHTRSAVAVYTEKSGTLELAPAIDGLTNPYPNPVADPEDPLTFHCLMHELRRDQGAQIQFSDVDLQGSVSVSASNIRKNNDLGGHRQYYTVNAAIPKDEATGALIPYQFGAMRVLDIQGDYVRGVDGRPVVDSAGKPVISTASVGTFDPVDSSSMREDAEWFKRMLYDRHNLLWKLAEGQVSGESRRESRSAFDRDLPDEATPAEGALEWAIATAYRYAQFIQGAEAPASIDVDARFFLRTTPTDLETWKTAVEQYKAGVLDLLTLGEMNPYGVDSAQFVTRVQEALSSNPVFAIAARTAGLADTEFLSILAAAGLKLKPETISHAQTIAALGLEGAAAGAEGGENGTGDSRPGDSGTA